MGRFTRLAVRSPRWGMGRWIILLTVLGGPLCAMAASDPVAHHWHHPNAGRIPDAAQKSDGHAEVCRACHEVQWSNWSGSRHANAFSPGLLAALLERSRQGVDACLRCHAPLVEQREALHRQDPFFEWQDQAAWPQRLADGIACPICHQRQGRLITPRSTSEKSTASDQELTIHRQRQPSEWLSQSHFCAACHQADPQQKRTIGDGEPLLHNTFSEWRKSPFAARGLHCQGCHMPKRHHLFRGIHDPAMTRSGVTVCMDVTHPEKVVLTLRSTRVGHMFPTYATPRIVLLGTRLDSASHPLDPAPQRWVIQRRMRWSQGGWHPWRDTRLAPGATASLEVPWQRAGVLASSINLQIRVEPDHLYTTHIHPRRLVESADPTVRKLLQRAIGEGEANNYTLWAQTAHRNRVDDQITRSPPMWHPNTREHNPLDHIPIPPVGDTTCP
ncbi:MAG: hypothetical protein HQL53_04145 [Magnetococcales bacterium]|nr:hypothetical protein [Magnetococcales bacterium]